MTAKWKSLIGSGVGGVLVMACLDLLRKHGYLTETPILLRLFICGILGAGTSWAVHSIFCRVGKH